MLVVALLGGGRVGRVGPAAWRAGSGAAGCWAPDAARAGTLAVMSDSLGT